MLDGNRNNDDEKPGAEEIYERATNATNLKQEAERRTSADVLRDMAMSADRFGGMLMRLRGQWSASSRPERQVARTVKQFLALLGDKEKAIAAHHEEQRRCDASYENALATLAARLPDLDLVKEQLTFVAVKWGMGKPMDPITRSERTEQHENDDKMLNDMRAAVEAATDDAQKMTAQATLNHWIIEVRRSRAEEEREDRQRAQAKVGTAIRYWLSQTCPRCDGLKFQVIPGTARLSTKMCPPVKQGGCDGTGFLPADQEVRRLANHMDHCVQRYRQLSNTRRALINLPLSERIPKALRHGKNPKSLKAGPDPEAD